jgi:hypothetical protein
MHLHEVFISGFTIHFQNDHLQPQYASWSVVVISSLELFSTLFLQHPKCDRAKYLAFQSFDLTRDFECSNTDKNLGGWSPEVRVANVVHNHALPSIDQKAITEIRFDRKAKMERTSVVSHHSVT